MTKKWTDAQYNWAKSRYEELLQLENVDKDMADKYYMECVLLLALITDYEESKKNPLTGVFFDNLLQFWEKSISRIDKPALREICLMNYKKFCSILEIIPSTQEKQ